MSYSKIEHILHQEAIQEANLERQQKRAAWLKRESIKRNGGSVSVQVKAEMNAERIADAKAAEASGKWVSIVNGVKCDASSAKNRRRRRAKQSTTGSSNKNNTAASQSGFAALNLDSDSDDEISRPLPPPTSSMSLTRTTSVAPVASTWSSVAKISQEQGNVVQKWERIPGSSRTGVPTVSKVSDFVTVAATTRTPFQSPVPSTRKSMDAWDDSDDADNQSIATNAPRRVFNWADECDSDSDEE